MVFRERGEDGMGYRLKQVSKWLLIGFTEHVLVAEPQKDACGRMNSLVRRLANKVYREIGRRFPHPNIGVSIPIETSHDVVIWKVDGWPVGIRTPNRTMDVFDDPWYMITRRGHHNDPRWIWGHAELDGRRNGDAVEREGILRKGCH